MAGRRSILPALLVASWFVGCGQSDGYDRVPIRGRVTLDGEPLKSGVIAFVPLGAGPSVEGAIAESAYEIGRSDGPSAGPYRVEISSMQPTGRRVADGDNPGETIAEIRNLVPERYNIRSALRVEVTPGKESNHDFALESRGTGAGKKPR